ncbi:hypothetical protein GGU10DRAFT_435588 [Lentinula aff. detonsa]|uniref:Uncharacterized protein n=1 Tax=Lentinula aff. detonsa TaxID=2804958 RepID=A0AA38NLB8_9AGAR|nr:hypothetical protein GGU10DRAFT_435588 [Lentinula aff. detonsa]
MSVSVQSAADVKDKFNWFFYGFVISTLLAYHSDFFNYLCLNMSPSDLLVQRQFRHGFITQQTKTGGPYARYNNLTVFEITNFGNVEIFTSFSLINIFFASRVYKLQQAPFVITLIVVASALGSIVAGLMLSARLFQNGNSQLMAFYDTKAMVEMGIALVLAAFSEILALTTISFSLHNSRTGYKQ